MTELKDKTLYVSHKIAIYAGGCFWGVEHLMEKQNGVIEVESGYIGGSIKDPTYEIICTGVSGHAEAVRVTFNPELINYETLAKLFFEIHDPTQYNKQGPDIGDQYRSGIFYMNEEQAGIARDLLGQLSARGLRIATEVREATEFYEAEDYHQDYYFNNGKMPYCHSYTKRF